MNFVYEYPSIPVRVYLVNAVEDVMAMIAIKFLRGVMLGKDQLIDLILLVYDNDLELDKAEQLKWNLEAAAFPCNNSVTITSKLPRITDGDVFIVISNFLNPNSLDFKKAHTEKYFEALYLILKFAINLGNPVEEPPAPEKTSSKKNIKHEIVKPRRPVILTDGLVALDIIKTFSKNLPDNIFFCPTPMSAVSRSILAEHLKVLCTDINIIYVWGANDVVFHVDVQVPVYRPQKSTRRGPCEWDVMSNRDLADLNLDYSQYNAGWMKKDLIYKVATKLTQQSRGSISNGVKVANSLKQIWKTRCSTAPEPFHKCNLGVISDGSLDTIKGLPYFLPVIFTDSSFVINEHLKDDMHLKHEIKRINKAALECHKKLKNFCKKFLQKYVIRQDFTLSVDDILEGAETTAATTDTPLLFPDARADDEGFDHGHSFEADSW